MLPTIPGLDWLKYVLHHMWYWKRLAIAKLILILCISGFNLKSAYAQRYHFQSLVLHVGMNYVESEVLPLYQLETIFSQAPALQINFGDFHQDTIVNHIPTLPIRFAIEFPFVKNDSSRKTFLNSEFNLKFGYFRNELFYQNQLQEQFQTADPLNFDTIHRNYFAFWWNSNNINVGVNWMIRTKYIGKHKRSRFWVGTGFLTGFSFGNLFVFHLNGKYFARHVSNGTSGYSYTFPAIEENVNTIRYSAPFYATLNPEIPLGYEIALGKKRTFLLGIQICNGYLWMLNSYHPSISGATMGFTYTLRFLQ